MSRPDLLALGDVPDLGVVPVHMHAQVIRAERFGEPRDAFQPEALAIPELAPHDVLVYVMAAGVNYNNVWAAMGIPIDVIKTRQKKGEREDFHVGGSDASGVVWAIGSAVTSVAVGDDVVVHCGMWEVPDGYAGDPMFHPTQRIWGYESNWGSFAQYTRVQDHQCVPKPPDLTWEQAAAYMLVGATAYRMLHGWSPNVVRDGDPVLIWGGAGGLGSMAIQIVRGQAGGRRDRDGGVGRRQESVLQAARRGRRDRSAQVRSLGQAPALVRRHRDGPVAQGRARVWRRVLGRARREQLKR